MSVDWCPWAEDKLLVQEGRKLHLYRVPSLDNKKQPQLSSEHNLHITRSNGELAVERIGGYAKSITQKELGPCVVEWSPKENEQNWVAVNFGSTATYIAPLVKRHDATEDDSDPEMLPTLSAQGYGRCSSLAWNSQFDNLLAVGYYSKIEGNIHIWDPQRTSVRITEHKTKFRTSGASQGQPQRSTRQHRVTSQLSYGVSMVGNGAPIRDLKWHVAQRNLLLAVMSTGLACLDIRASSKEAQQYSSAGLTMMDMCRADTNMIAVGGASTIQLLDLRKLASPMVSSIRVTGKLKTLSFAHTKPKMLCYADDSTSNLHSFDVARSLKRFYVFPTVNHSTFTQDRVCSMSHHFSHPSRMAVLTTKGKISDVELKQPANVLQSPQGYHLRHRDNHMILWRSEAGVYGVNASSGMLQQLPTSIELADTDISETERLMQELHPGTFPGDGQMAEEQIHSAMHYNLPSQGSNGSGNTTRGSGNSSNSDYFQEADLTSRTRSSKPGGYAQTKAKAANIPVPLKENGDESDDDYDEEGDDAVADAAVDGAQGVSVQTSSGTSDSIASHGQAAKKGRRTAQANAPVTVRECDVLVSGGLSRSTRSIADAAALPPVTEEARQRNIAAVMFDRACNHYAFDLDTNIQVVADDKVIQQVWMWLQNQQNRQDSVTGNYAPISISTIISAPKQAHTWLRSMLLELVKSRYSISRGDSSQKQALELERKCTAPVESVIGRQLLDHHPDRKIALTLCDWDSPYNSATFQEAHLNTRANTLKRYKQFERAAAYLLFHNGPAKAFELLASLPNTPEHAYLILIGTALKGATDADQRSTLAKSFLPVVSNPYLQAMLLTIISPEEKPTTEICKVVAESNGIHISDRIGFMLRFLQDQDELIKIVNALTETAVQEGHLHGLMLTGVSDRSLELLQNYLDNTCDLQTAVLLTLYCLGLKQNTNIHPDTRRNRELQNDPRVVAWLEEYRDMLDKWQLYNARIRFDIDSKRKRKMPRMDMQCSHCSKSVVGMNVSAIPTQLHNNCQQCRLRLPECVICTRNMSLLSTDAKANRRDPFRARVGQQKVFPSMITLCQCCKHGGHARCLLNWFQLHAECPAAGCRCKCMKGGNQSTADKE